MQRQMLSPFMYPPYKIIRLFFLLLLVLNFKDGSAQTGTLTGTGMSICNLYSFSICPNQTITPLNYGNQGYACTGLSMPDVSFTTMGGSWRVMKNNWVFVATTGGQVSGYTSSGTFQTFPFSATNSITPQSYSGTFVQFAINNVTTGLPLNQATFSISLVPVVFGGNTYTYCPAINPNVAISPVVPSQGGPWTYSWLPGNLAGNPVNVSPSVSTVYTVTARTAANCPSTATIAVNVSCCSAVLTPSINTIDISCNSATGSVIINSVSNGTAPYTLKEGTTTLASSINLPYALGGVTAGTHTYVISSGGCNATFTTTIATNTLTPNLSVSNTATLNCNTAVASLAAASTSTNAVSYSWSGVNIVSGSSTPTAVVSQAGNYTVTVADGLCTNTAVVNVVSNSNIPDLSVTNPGTLTCSATSLTALATSTTAGVTYSWMPQGVTTSTVSVSMAGNYTVVVTDTVSTCANSSVIAVPQNTVAPIPTVTSPLVLTCLNTSLVLTAGSTAANFSYSWSPQGVTTATVLVNATGNYSLAVSDPANGCSSITVLSVTQNTVTPVVAITSSGMITCSQPTVVLTGTSATQGLNYQWATGPATSAYSVTSAGTYSLTVTDPVNGCSSSTNTAVVSNITPMVLSTSADTTICSGRQVTLSVNGASSYTWSPSSSLNSASGSTVTAVPGSSTVYTVTGSSVNGCTGSATVAVTTILTPTVTFASNTTSLCAGTSTLLTAFGATSYTWSPGTTLSGIYTSTVTASPLSTTVYSVIGVNTTGNTSCISSNTITVEVTPVITPTVSTDNKICKGQSTKIYVAGGNVYQWASPVDANQQGNAVVSISPSVTTVYSVSVSNNHLCPVTTTVEVIVNPLPVINAGRDTTVNIDEVLLLTGKGDVPVGFIAGTGPALNCTFCSSLKVNPQENTCYTLMGENEYHCLAFDEVCVTVTKDWDIFIPNTFSPNGDGTNDTFVAYGYGISQVDMMVFDRWGNTMFKETDTHTGWDGIKNGVVCEQSIYVYKIGILTMGGAYIQREGHVTLLPKK